MGYVRIRDDINANCFFLLYIGLNGKTHLTITLSNIFDEK